MSKVIALIRRSPKHDTGALHFGCEPFVSHIVKTEDGKLYYVDTSWLGALIGYETMAFPCQERTDAFPQPDNLNNDYFVTDWTEVMCNRTFDDDKWEDIHDDICRNLEQRIEDYGSPFFIDCEIGDEIKEKDLKTKTEV